MPERRTKVDEVAAWLTSSIRSGDLSPDQPLPTEACLMDRFDVGRGTVRGAYTRLAEQGVVRSVRGHGWYIRRDNRVRFPLMSVDQGRRTAARDVWNTLLGNLGRKGDQVLLSVETEEPPDKVTRLLRLKQDRGEQAVVRRRVRLVGNEVWMISNGYFPADIAYGTALTKCVDMQNPSPLALLMRMGYEPVRDVDLIGSRMPTAEECRVLGIERGTPLITNYRTSTDRTGRPFRCTEDVFPASRFELTVEQDY